MGARLPRFEFTCKRSRILTALPNSRFMSRTIRRRRSCPAQRHFAGLNELNFNNFHWTVRKIDSSQGAQDCTHAARKYRYIINRLMMFDVFRATQEACTRKLGLAQTHVCLAMHVSSECDKVRLSGAFRNLISGVEETFIARHVANACARRCRRCVANSKPHSRLSDTAKPNKINS